MPREPAADVPGQAPPPDDTAPQVPDQGGSTPEEQAEVERLRAELSDLQAQLAEGGSTGEDGVSGRRTGRWRPWVAGVLIAVGALLAPASIVAAWANDQISDTDSYVETVTPIGSDPVVQDAIIARITNEIFARLDVEELTREAVAALAAQGLPPRVAEGLTALAAPIEGGVRNFVTEQVTRIVKSPEFEQAWVAANREAHTQMVAVLTGEGTETVDVTGDTVSVNLAVIIDTVKAQLVNAGFGLASRIPEVNAQFTILQSEDLTKLQTAFRFLDRVALALPVLGLLLLALAVYIARDRRKALLAAALAVAGSMLLLGATLNAFRPIYLESLPPTVHSHAAAGVVYDTLVEFIRLNLRAVLVVALAVAAGAWLAGKSAAPTATRRGVSRAMSAIRGGGEHIGVSTGPVGVFAYTYRTALRALVIGIALLVYIQAEHPTGGWTLKVLGITVAVLLLLELVARPPKEQGTAPGPGSSATSTSNA